MKCNRMIYQDQSDRCELEAGHEGFCGFLLQPHKLEVIPYKEPRTVYEDNPHYRQVSRGDGIIYTVPTWIADILERHQDEIN